MGYVALEAIYNCVPWLAIFVTYICIFVDLFYGVLIAYILGDPRSHIMLKGLKSKVFVLFVPVLAIIIKAFFIVCELPAGWSGTDNVHQVLGVVQLSDFPICFFLCLFVIIMEIYSFLENSAKINHFAATILAKFNKELAKEFEEQRIAKKIFTGKDK